METLIGNEEGLKKQEGGMRVFGRDEKEGL